LSVGKGKQLIGDELYLYLFNTQFVSTGFVSETMNGCKVLVVVVVFSPKLIPNKLTPWMHECTCYFECHATFAMIGGPPKEIKLDGVWRGREKKSKVGWGPPKLTPITTSWRC
jgi:hypothetical protein